MTTVPMGVTFGSLAVLGPAAITDIAQSAQNLGYQSIWTVEATGSQFSSKPYFSLAMKKIPNGADLASPDDISIALADSKLEDEAILSSQTSANPI